MGDGPQDEVAARLLILPKFRERGPQPVILFLVGAGLSLNMPLFDMWNRPSKRLLKVLQTLRGEWREEIFWLCDVGAAGGLAERWKPYRPWVRTLGFEPSSSEFAKLSAGSEDRLIHAASAGYNGRRTLYLTQYWSNSSLLPPNADLIRELEWGDDHRVVKEEGVPCVTVDTACEENRVEIDFFKVDTQGTELDILKGAAQQLHRQAVCVEVEVEFCELYRGQPLFAEVDCYLRQQGFYLHELGNLLTVKPRGKGGFGGVKGRLVSADALYFKKAAPDRLTAHQLQALFLAYLVYGYSEEALSILEMGALPLSAKIVPDLTAQLAGLRSTPQWLQRLPGWSVVCRVGKKLWQKHNVVGASNWDRPLGNDF